MLRSVPVIFESSATVIGKIADFEFDILSMRDVNCDIFSLSNIILSTFRYEILILRSIAVPCSLLLIFFFFESCSASFFPSSFLVPFESEFAILYFRPSSLLRFGEFRNELCVLLFGFSQLLQPISAAFVRFREKFRKRYFCRSIAHLYSSMVFVAVVTDFNSCVLIVVTRISKAGKSSDTVFIGAI